MKKLKNSTKLVITENVNVLCKNKNIMIIDKDIEIYIYISQLNIPEYTNQNQEEKE